MISNTAQINTFTGGMNTDTDINLLPNNQYRYGQDVRIVTDDEGTSGVLQSADGAKKYNYSIKNTERIIGTATINDIAVVVTKLNDEYNKIYRIENFNSPNPTSTVILKGKLGIGKDYDSNQISIVLNYETISNIKMYFTDGGSIIKVINIMDDKYVQYPDIDNPLLDEEGNILNPNSIDIIPNAVLHPFVIRNLVNGNFKAGMVQYCYRLYNPHSPQTSLSSLSKLVHLSASNSSEGLQDYYGSAKGSITGKGVVLSAPLDTKDFTRCTIIRIFYEDNDSAPIYSIIDDVEVNIASDEINYTDTGSSGISTLTQEEFNALTSYAFICNSITTVQNRLFASNVTETSWVPMIEDVDGEIVEYDARAYRANSDGYIRIETADPEQYMYFGIDDVISMRKVPKEHDCINPYNLITQDRYKAIKYVYGRNGKLGGNGLNVEYSFVKTQLIESTYSINGGGLRNEVGMSSVLTRVDEVGIQDISDNTILYKDTDYGRIMQKNEADPIIASRYRGYQRDEIYRFGIVFYNDKFIPSPVLWIGDIRFPDQDDCPILAALGVLYTVPLGVSFKVKNMPIDAVAYEIVRCDRTLEDRTIVSQGIITPICNYKIVETSENGEIGIGESNKETNEYRPMPFLHTKRRPMQIAQMRDVDLVAQNFESGVIGVGDISDKYWRFISPEVCFNGEKMEDLFKSNIYIEQQNLLLSSFDVNLVLQDKDNVRNCIAVSSENIYPPNGESSSSYTMEKARKYARTYTIGGRLGTWVFQFSGLDYCNAYVQKFLIRGNSTMYGHSQNISDAKYPPIIPYNVTNNGGVKPYKINIGDITYSNWTASEFFTSGEVLTYGPAGPCLILQISSDSIGNIYGVGAGTDTNFTNGCPVIVVNAKRGIVPYNGNTYSARTNSVYVSIGAYNKQISDPIYVFGGDTYIGLLDYPSQMIFTRNDVSEWKTAKRYFGAYIPFESTINMKLSMGEMAGRTYNASLNTIDAFLQIEPVQMQGFHAQSKPYYLYNDAYSVVSDAKLFTTRGLYDEANVKSYNRVYTSQAKTTNENVDSWSIFKPADYIDVDSKYGQITNIKGIFNKLYFWQNTAFGQLSVNERSLVQDNNVGQLVLGTGGVLDRYDYISTTNGSSVVNDRSIINSNSNVYWYDQDNNEIVKFGGQGLNIISKECNVQAYMNNMYDQKTKEANSVYDKKYDEIWFRLYNKSLIYNERLNIFTSLYTFDPDFTLPFKDKVVTTKNNDFYVINSLQIDGFGDADKDVQLKIVVNKDPQYTKVFDNIAFQGEFIAPNNKILTQDVLRGAKFDTKHQTSTRQGEDLKFDYREDTYRLPVPRQDDFEENESLSFPARMRGKYMECEYKFKSDKDYSFQMPQITTTYRYSKI